MKPLIAIDLNSNIETDALKTFLEKMFKKFGALDVVFIMDDESLVEVEHKIVHTFYNVRDILHNFEFLRKLSDKTKLSLHISSLVSLNSELKKFPLIVVTDRSLKPTSNHLLFIFDGSSIKSSNKEFVLSRNKDNDQQY